MEQYFNHFFIGKSLTQVMQERIIFNNARKEFDSIEADILLENIGDWDNYVERHKHIFGFEPSGVSFGK